jgi:hypothetical protein
VNEIHRHCVSPLGHCLAKFKWRCRWLLIVNLPWTAKVGLRAPSWLNCRALSLRVLRKKLRWHTGSLTLLFYKVHWHFIESGSEMLHLLLLGKLLLLLVNPLTLFDESIFDSETGRNVNQAVIIAIGVAASMLISDAASIMRWSIWRGVSVVSGVVCFRFESAVLIFKLGLLL